MTKQGNLHRNRFFAMLLAVSFALGVAAPQPVLAYDATVITAPQNLEELRRADIAEVAKLPRFDGRDYGIITPVKDQGDSNLCWAYTAVNASEASILREGIDPNITKNTLSLSPRVVGYARFQRPADPLGNTEGSVDDSTKWADYHSILRS